MKYKLNQVSLKPDKYGNHLVIKMITQYDDNGKYVKHIKIDENAINMLKNNFVIESENI